MERQEDYIVLDTWICGDRIRVEQLWSNSQEAQMFSTRFVDREPPGIKRERDMYSCHHGKQSILPEKGIWTFARAERKFQKWLIAIENETLEQNPEKELDKYIVEMFQYLFLHEKVRKSIIGFPSQTALISFRGMVLRDHEQIALIFKED